MKGIKQYFIKRKQKKKLRALKKEQQIQQQNKETVELLIGFCQIHNQLEQKQVLHFGIGLSVGLGLALLLQQNTLK